MREVLGQLNGKKLVFYATFKRFGWRRFMGKYVGKTLLFVDIRDKDGNLRADHLWFKMGHRFERLNLKKGDQICFQARVDTYTKGGRDSDDFDYHLEYAENLRKMNDPEQTLLSVNT